MATQSMDPQSRRHVLAAALAGLGGLAAAALHRPVPVSADTGDNFVLGSDNTADATTRLTSTDPTFGVPALEILPHQSGTGLRIVAAGLHGIRA